MFSLQKNSITYTLELHQNTHIHSVVFSNTYQLLLTSAYDQRVNIFKFAHDHVDLEMVGCLEGHQSLIFAIQVIEHSPIVITCDDKHILKLWDIRQFRCI